MKSKHRNGNGAEQRASKAKGQANGQPKQVSEAHKASKQGNAMPRSGSEPPAKKMRVASGTAAVAGETAAVAGQEKHKQKNKDNISRQPKAHPAKQDGAGGGSTLDGKAAPQGAQAGNGKKRPRDSETGANASNNPAVPVVTSRPGKNGATVGSNWALMQQAIKKSSAEAAANHHHHHGRSSQQAASKRPGSVGANSSLTPVVAMDCEMVGVGPNGAKSVLARVCIVNSAGNVLLDTFVQPMEKVTDFRTWVSGVRPADVARGRPHLEVVDQVAGLVKGRIIVGHALHNDFKVLQLEHPKELVRDTSRYPPLMRSLPNGRLIPQSLRELSAQHLGLTIQAGEHSPVDDARCALYLYQRHRKDWDALVRSGRSNAQHHVPLKQGAKKRQAGASAAAAGAGQAKRKKSKTLSAVLAGDLKADPFADL